MILLVAASLLVATDSLSADASISRKTSNLPTVTLITPTSGPAIGGTLVTISGKHLTTRVGRSKLHFGGRTVVAKCSSATLCTAKTTPGTGTVSVRISTTAGRSYVSSATEFTYIE